MEPLPAAAVRLLLLHVRRRDGGGRRGNPHSSVGVNDGNGIAGPYRRWLVEFHLRLVVVVLLLMVVRGDGDGRLGHVARRVLKCLCQREWRRHLLHRLNLLLKRRRRGRAGRQGRSVRGRGNRLKLLEKASVSHQNPETKCKSAGTLIHLWKSHSHRLPSTTQGRTPSHHRDRSLCRPRSVLGRQRRRERR